MSDVFSDMPSIDVTRYSAPKVVSDSAKPMTVKDALPASNVNSNSTDSVELSTAQKPKKKGPIKRLKEFIANVKKFFATAGEYTKGFFKGIVQGATVGALVYTAGDIINYVRANAAKAAAQATAEAGTETVQKVVKKIPNKFLAGVALVGAIAINLWNASLNATEKRSEIEHRWTGHNQ